MSGAAFIPSALGDCPRAAPGKAAWTLAVVFGLAVHGLALGAWLWRSEPPLIGVGPGDGGGIGVALAPPPSAPPAQEAPQEPEPEPEPEVIRERVEDAPPPTAPPEPRPEPEDPKPRTIDSEVEGVWGGGGGDLTIEEFMRLKQWLVIVRREFLGRIDYPVVARRRRLEGEGHFIITVDNGGRIRNWAWDRRTGEEMLDRAVERGSRAVRRLPPFPPGLKHRRLAYRIHVRFEMYETEG